MIGFVSVIDIRRQSKAVTKAYVYFGLNATIDELVRDEIKSDLLVAASGPMQPII